MKFFFLLLLIFICNLKTYAADDCKLEKQLTLADINPNIIHETMKSDKINNIGDVVCCLPQSFRDSIKVVNHSNSGQPGTRVFLGGFKKFSVVMSLSGEVNDNAPGAHKLEMMSNFEGENEKALFDGSIDPDTKNFKVEKNPSSCLGCHGKLGINQPQGYEIRAIFDRFPWTRSNSDLNTLEGRHVPVDKYCKNIEKYLKVYGEFKREQIKDLDRFRCIDHEKIMKARIGFAEDKDFRAPNEGRALRLLKTERFKAFQYYFAGVAYGCLPSAEETDYSEISNWIPSNILNNRSGIVPTPKTVENLSLEEVFKKRKEESTKIHGQVFRVNNLLGQMSNKELTDPNIFVRHNIEKLSNYCSAYPDKSFLRGAKAVFQKNKAWIERQPAVLQNHIKSDILSEQVGEFTGLSMVKMLNHVGIEAMGINIQELAARFDRTDFDPINLVPALTDNNIFKRSDFTKRKSRRSSAEIKAWCEKVSKHSFKVLSEYSKKHLQKVNNGTNSSGGSVVN